MASIGGKPLRVLIVEDSANDAELLVAYLERSGYAVTSQRVQTADDMRAALERTTWDAVLSDYSMPGFSGLAALDILRATGQDIPFIIASGTIGDEAAVSALKAGAHDFLVKGRLARLGPALERELHEVSERRERLQVQKALRQSEARFRSLVDHAVFGLYQATPDGRFLSVNPALVAILGYGSADELLRVTLPSLCCDDAGRSDLTDRIHKLPRFTGEEVIWMRATGGPIRVRLSGGVIDVPDGPSVLEVIVEDVTERHRLEQQLRQSQKMEGIGRLAGGIAHDFNNMLTIITGYSEMVLEQIGSDKPISGDLLEIRKATDRAADLTRQLLAFSRQQVLRMGNVDVNDVVANMRSMLQRLIGEDVTIQLALASGLRPTVADRVQLEQVLLNLAGNARDALPRGGHLTIGTSSISAADAVALSGLVISSGTYISLTITDDGTGMDERTRQQIFEPFFTTKELGKGTGLGLATVYGIVIQLSGYIWVSSELGRGTTFTVLLPQSLSDNATTDAPHPHTAAASLATRHEVVLLVEDDAALRTLVSRSLRRHGYLVFEAATGQEGLASMAEHGNRIQLVITDVVMPVMSGPEMIREIRQTMPELSVLFMSGYAGAKITQDSLEHGHAAFLSKPFTVHDLLQTVRGLLDVDES